MFRRLINSNILTMPFRSKTSSCCSRHQPIKAYKYSVQNTNIIHRNIKVDVYIKRVSGFHTSPRRDVPPWLLLYIVKPGMKVIAVLGGRATRKHWKELPTSKKIAYVSAILGTLGSVLTVYYLSHIQDTPITKRKRFVCVTGPQLQQIVQFEAELLKESYKESVLPATHPYYNIVLSVARRILKANQDLPELKDMKWTIAIVNDKSINAMVLPTGDVFITTALMEFVDNVDQLAVVFGHEMSHALLSHSAENLSITTFVDYATIVLMAMGWCVIPSDGIAVVTNWFFNKVTNMMIHLPYSRQMEEEADKVGLHLAAKACYDIREGSVFWRKMWMNKSASSLHVGKDEGAFLSTHPPHEKRVKINDSLVPELTKLRNEYSCPPLPSIDPRKYAIEKQKKVHDAVIARKAGQDLRQVKMATRAE